MLTYENTKVRISTENLVKTHINDAMKNDINKSLKDISDLKEKAKKD